MQLLAAGEAAGGGRTRVRVGVEGAVQGVGFRPFAFALARELGLAGSVGNTAGGVVAEVEGAPEHVDAFVRRLRDDAPPLAIVDRVRSETIAVRGGTDFVIDDSRGGPGRTLVSPDIATCPDCLRELADPHDRRFAHAFISCTNCGPRFTVVRDVPYDRPATTMADLPLCPRCAAEYADPGDRRFHAQTVACPDCGPTLTLHHLGAVHTGDDALARTRTLLADGSIVAIKGVGGFHLACDATNAAAVDTLRKRKDRGDKPFALLVPDLAAAGTIVTPDPAEQALLVDPRRPVVLVARRPEPALELADGVAPGSPDLGVLLPYTPVHHLLFGAGAPPVLVLTSGNLAGEPIVVDGDVARERLAGVADAWLDNDRPIHVPCDDSVLRVAGGEPLPVRRSRGYAPLPVALPVEVEPALAVGGDLKNTFCLAEGRYAWLSAHVGDMDDLATLQAFEAATAHLASLTRVTPGTIVADRHPAYRSAQWATRAAGHRPVRRVQHHHAHIASVMAENGHDGSARVIGFAFDGTGFGDDGAVWGGEVLLADYDGYERAAHLRYTPLPGGDAGVRNPCRMALSHLRAAAVEWDPLLPPVAACSESERHVLDRQLRTGFGCTPTSSLGRLFDAMSSLAGVCHRVEYEAEAAMRFEGLARTAVDGCGDPYRFGPGLDARPVIAAAAADVRAGVDAETVAARFHLAVVDAVVMTAQRVRRDTGLDTAALSGGVFLNALLTVRCRDALESAGFRVLRHRHVPPSDAGLALGQLVIGARRRETT
ncbi:MAG TPA: carbamoyltransferase HypF [Jatrophihabitans sp.]|jgi:hydrogenase maturation protein HypF|uniref:carbamoyltransferase HypF n=1 Tax=Jatrophihabitans sp. TaxID=1932789 RepID=UPI002E0BBE2D|nr:carbamoyltransferase HypF [Jatrophihabitans sp.]